jgi:CTP:molybdopterin cytidylyltransferase MocA
MTARAVVVNAAGRGRRLGLDRPKALLEIAGRPLIEWQLSMLHAVDDVRVVVGFQAEATAHAVQRVRPDATIVVNEQFDTTGTAASLVLGAAVSPAHVLSLDCDLVVHPDDLRLVLDGPVPALGILPVQSVEPVMVVVEDVSGQPTALSFADPRQEPPPPQAGEQWVCEWSGLTVFDPGEPSLGPDQGHVFRLIEPLLPMPAIPIRAVEVDHPEEIPMMTRWIDALVEEGALR